MGCNCNSNDTHTYSEGIHISTGHATETDGKAGNIEIRGGDGNEGGSIALIPGDGETKGKLCFFTDPGGGGSTQQALARPSGDAGDLWDILNAYGLVVEP